LIAEPKLKKGIKNYLHFPGFAETHQGYAAPASRKKIMCLQHRAHRYK
jgi:hypothetical protein